MATVGGVKNTNTTKTAPEAPFDEDILPKPEETYTEEDVAIPKDQISAEIRPKATKKESLDDKPVPEVRDREPIPQVKDYTPKRSDQPNQSDNVEVDTPSSQEAKPEIKNEDTTKKPEYVLADEVSLNASIDDLKKEEERLRLERDKLLAEIEKLSTPKIDVADIDENDSEKKRDVVIMENRDGVNIATPDEAMIKRKELEDKVDEHENKRYRRGIYENAGDSACSVSSKANTVKRLSDFEFDPNKIQFKTSASQETEEAFRSQYLDVANSPIHSARMTRIPALMSGYYCDIKDYSYGDLVTVLKDVEGTGRFGYKFERELDSIYNHIGWASFCDRTPTKQEWFENTLMPDLKEFYWGIYDATFPGATTYSVGCTAANCDYTFSLSKDNKALHFSLPGNDMTGKYIRDVLVGKATVNSMKEKSLYREAHQTIDDKILQTYRYKVSYGVPTIRDVLEWLTVFEEVLGDAFEDFDALIDDDNENHLILKLFTYLRKIAVPVIVGKNEKGVDIIDFYTIDGTVKDEAKRIENKTRMLQIVNALPKNELAELFRGENVARLVTLSGLDHMIHNAKCPQCGHVITRVIISIREVFFGEAQQAVKNMGIL